MELLETLTLIIDQHQIDPRWFEEDYSKDRTLQCLDTIKEIVKDSGAFIREEK